jgi:hypothetical protein
MHHKRVVQEKNKLIDDLKRLRNHLRSYEPTIEELRNMISYLNDFLSNLVFKF